MVSSAGTKLSQIFGVMFETPMERILPAARFLVQTDDFAFRELARSSTLPFFVTDLGGADLFDPQSRVLVPITDAEANVTYYLISCGSPARINEPPARWHST